MTGRTITKASLWFLACLLSSVIIAGCGNVDDDDNDAALSDDDDAADDDDDNDNNDNNNDTSGEICSPDGWCWRNPLPQGNGLSAVWAAPA